jgi:hypothetical protein
MHLLIARYEGDPERKRIEYILDKWKDKLRITKPEGIISILDGEGLEDFVEELYSRTSRANVSLYRIEEQDVDVEKGQREIRMTLDEKKETVDRLIGFVMAKQKAILKHERKDPLQKTYELITKKGKAEVSVTLHENDHKVDMRLKISGYGEVVEFLSSKLDEELRYLEGR